MKYLTVKESLSFGWEMYKKYWRLLVGIFIFIAVLSIIVGFIAEEGNSGSSYLLNMLLQSFVGVGVITISLAIYEKKEGIEFKTFFSRMEYFINYFIGILIYSIIIFVGLILFVIPGIIWALKYQFFGYFVVERGLSPMDAIRESGKITMGKKWFLFRLWVVLIVLNIIGALFVGVGLLVTLPLTILSTVYVYKKILEKKEEHAG